MPKINSTPHIELRRASITDQQGKTTEFTRATKNVKNDSQEYSKKITDKKTVHLTDVKQLRNEVSSLISSIKDILFIGDNISTQHLITRDSPIFENVDNKISELGKKITELKGKLDSSSYQHHKSKKADLNALNNAFTPEKGLISQLKVKMTQLKESSYSTKELAAEIKENQKISHQKDFFEESAAGKRRTHDYYLNGTK